MVARKVPVEVVSDAFTILGAHIGVEHVAFGVTGIDGRVQSERRITYDGTWDGARSAITACVQAVPAGPPVLGLGVIVAGQVDSDRGTLLAHQALGWNPVPMREDLTRDVGYPLFIESSVRAHATADILFGVASGVRNFVHVFVGNVIEMAVVVDGVVLAGREGANGNLSDWLVADRAGRAVPAISALGDRAIVQLAREEGLVGAGDGLDSVVDAAAQGVGRAGEILLGRARGVGVLLAQVDAMLGPELIVISSGVLAVDGALEAAADVLRAACRTVPPPVRASRYGANPLVSAAAALVLERALLSSDLALPLDGD